MLIALPPVVKAEFSRFGPRIRNSQSAIAMGSRLHSRQRDALDEVLLGEEEDDDDGDGHEQAAGHGQRGVVADLQAERVLAGDGHTPVSREYCPRGLS